MNSTTKKFLSAILTTAIVFTQAGATVSAATSSTWGTSTSATQTTNTKYTSKNYNNSSDYTDTDKYGNAFPYTYYYKVSQNKAYKTLYKYIADALRDRKSSLKFKGYAKKYSTQSFYDVINDLRNNCPDLYYVTGCTATKSGDDIIVKFNYMDAAEHKSIQKKIDKYCANFDAYLEKNNVTSTKDFLIYAAKYVDSTVSYDHDALKSKKTKIDTNSLSIVGAVVDGEAVCEGYVDTFNYLCMTYGISYAGKHVSTKTGGHKISCAVYNNIWYNFDPTGGNTSSYQFTTDKEYTNNKNNKGYKIVDNVEVSPVCNGKKVSRSSSASSSSFASTSKVTSKSALLNNKNKRLSDTGEVVDRFSKIVENNIKFAKEEGKDTVTLTFASKVDYYVESCYKKIQQLKKDGTIDYKSVEICTPETGERFILIYLK